MASIFQNIDRKVIPNFRSATKTFALGELNSFQITKSSFEGNIDEYLHAFLNNKKVPYAGDLLSAALINRQLDHPLVINAANFILDNEPESTSLQRKVAKQILGIQDKKAVP